MRTSRHSAGMTLVELMIVLAIAGSLIGVTSFSIGSWSQGQRVKDAARAVNDSFMLARGEAMRTGSNHIVVFRQGQAPADADIVIVNDNRPAASTCNFATSDIVHRTDFGAGVTFGGTAAISNGQTAPRDTGLAAATSAAGTTFTNAARNPAAASWAIYFEPDGIPRLFSRDAVSCTVRGLPGEAGGGIYVTNGERDFAIVLAPLGTSKVYSWDQVTGAWQ